MKGTNPAIMKFSALPFPMSHTCHELESAEECCGRGGLYIEGELLSQLCSLLVPCKNLANIKGCRIIKGPRQELSSASWGWQQSLSLWTLGCSGASDICGGRPPALAPEVAMETHVHPRGNSTSENVLLTTTHSDGRPLRGLIRRGDSSSVSKTCWLTSKGESAVITEPRGRPLRHANCHLSTVNSATEEEKERSRGKKQAIHERLDSSG